MPINYNVGTNIIEVVGYAAVAPCTFADIYAADKAGTLSLHARAGVSAIDGAGVAVDRAERPTDYVVLGGASNDLYITVANWAVMTTSTIRIIGTDRDGVAQTEDLVFVGNGTINTAKWFKTITHTQITVFTTPGGGSYDYDLIQGQWGVVWNQERQYMFDARLIIGDHNPTTYFADQKQQVLLNKVATSNGQIIWQISSETEFELGILEDAAKHITSGGVQIMIDEDVYSRCVFHPGWAAGTVANMYSTSVIQADQDVDVQNYWNDLWNVYIETVFEEVQSSNDIFNLTVSGSLSAPHTGITIEKIYILDHVNAGNFGSLTIWYPVIIRDLYIRKGIQGIMRIAIYNQNVDHSYFINADLDVWNVFYPWWMAAQTKLLYRQYDFDLKVVDSNGDGISGVTVAIEDVNGAAIGGSPFTTDVNGDIVTQVITHGTYSDPQAPPGIATLTELSPYTVTISKAGYVVREIIYTMDRQREEIEKLAGIPQAVEYRRRRVPSEVSEMIER